jgi:NAD-dependent dihydropyrimidine dehydrogenase PreA subunit
MPEAIVYIVIGVLLAGLLALWLYAERWYPLRPSTRRFFREAGLRRFLTFGSPHGYLYMRWINQYIHLAIHHAMPRIGPRSKKWFSDRYHGKILTHDLAEAFFTHDHNLPLTDLEQIIPYPVARSIVLEGPPDVAAYECACRANRPNPCQPTQVCMFVGQPFVDFILEHNPHSSRRLTQEEALELLRAEHERGHVHTAWFKEATSDRFYAICNCCKCCCGAIEGMMKHGIPLFASSGYVCHIDVTRCGDRDGCGEICQDVCPFEALHIDGVAVVEIARCMGCGVCVNKCPTQALSLVPDEAKGLPLDVRVLAQGQPV